MNIYDVSERARVSIAIVSRVLNGNPNVSEKTRGKVLGAMDRSGYTPNMFAKGLGLNTMEAIGVMCSDSLDPYLANAIYYLKRGLRAHGYNTIPCCTGYDLDTRQKYFDLLRSGQVNAIILASSKFVEIYAKDNTYIIEAAPNLPVMPANGFPEGENIHSIVYDDHAAVYGAASQLLSPGRGYVLYVYTGYSYSGVNKLEGYKGALKTEGATLPNELIRQCPKDIEAVGELLLSLHREGLELDAVITSDDLLAMGAVKYAHIADISTPRDLSIIGYNNSLLAQCTDPEITSIDSRVEALCITTINTLMGVFSGVNISSRTTIASDLVKRKAINFQPLRRNVTRETIYGQGFLTIN